MLDKPPFSWPGKVKRRITLSLKLSCFLFSLLSLGQKPPSLKAAQGGDSVLFFSKSGGKEDRNLRFQAGSAWAKVSL